MSAPRGDGTSDPGREGTSAPGGDGTSAAKSVGYRNELSRELTAVGITGRLRDRILTEISDHLACDPQADLGQPLALARQFADELGTSRARRAGFAAFGALALAGILFGLAFVTTSNKLFYDLGELPWPASASAVAIAFSTQIAFAAGVLAALRGLRRRRNPVIPAPEATVIVRRAAVGIAAGIVAMFALGVLAVELRHREPGSWATLAEVGAAVGLAGLLASVPWVWRALRVHPVLDGERGDVFDDVGGWAPAPLQGRPWRFALAFSGVVAVVIAIIGVLGADPYDGILRGIVDALACLAGFAVLGPFLGLWQPGGGDAAQALVAE
jgi:hypothetical protein